MRVLVGLTLVALTGCWGPIEFNELRVVPDQAKGQQYRALKARLARAGQAPKASTQAAQGATRKAPVAPPKSPAQMRFVKVTPEAAAKGKGAYAACAGCHGAEAEGRVGIAPRLASASFLAAASDQFLVDTIARGREGTTMVAWGSILKTDQIESIVAWLRTKAASTPAKLDESPCTGDVSKGAASFRAICATCHGRSGAGYLEAGSGTGIGRKAFLSKVTNGFLRHVIKHGKSQTAMRPFRSGSPTATANLDDAEIENVIAYLRAKAW